jgi:hypothetical protein
MISKKLFLAAFVIILFSANILAQGINWGLRLDALYINTTSNYETHTEEMETVVYYPRFFTSPQLMLNVYPIEQLGIEFRVGYDFIVTDFAGGEYSFYGKYHFYQPLYLVAGVCLKKMANNITNDKFSHRAGGRFGMPAIGIGGQITKHISAEIIYLQGNERLIEYSNIDDQDLSRLLRREKHLNYVIKLSAGFNWSIYDF